MITEEQAMKLLIEANPVPDMDLLDLSGDPPTTRLAEPESRSGGMTELKFQPSDTKPQSSRHGLLGIAAAVATLVVAGVFLFRTTDKAPVANQPMRVAEVATGLPGLAPEGATPSTPENGELVASMWEHIGAPGSFGNGWLYLYTDGRLIWAQADPNPTSGWLEQRLTPEGVELIRSEIIATGLFDPDQPPPEPNDGFPRATGGYVQVRNGDRLVYVNQVVPELMERLAELWSWLPDGAWEDTEAKAYVPSRYAVCMHDDGNVAPTDAQDRLSALPAAARDLLAGARQLPKDSLVDVDPAGFAWMEGSTEYCFDIATEEARTLATTLDDAGVEELPHRWYDGSEVFYLLSKTVAEYNRDPFNTTSLAIWPMLPHGVPAFIGA